MTRPARTEAWWDDYWSCRDEGMSVAAAVQYANDSQDEGDPLEAQWEADCAADEQLTETHGDPFLKRRVA